LFLPYLWRKINLDLKVHTLNQKMVDDLKLFSNKLKAEGVATRIAHLKQLKKSIHKAEDQIIEALRADLGKPEFESYTSEILMVQKEIDLFIKNLKNWAAPKRVSGSLLNFPSQDFILSEPYGSVLIISPWNYPFQLAMIPLIGAVAAGNSVVLKPSEHAPHTSKFLLTLLEGVFNTNGEK
jgi:aldehyde dehydrogenase (NAD+)